MIRALRVTAAAWLLGAGLFGFFFFVGVVAAGTLISEWTSQ